MNILHWRRRRAMREWWANMPRPDVVIPREVSGVSVFDGPKRRRLPLTSIRG